MLIQSQTERHLTHLLSRAGFGPSLQDWLTWTPLSQEAQLQRLFQDSEHYAPLTAPEMQLPKRGDRKSMTKAMRQANRKKGVQALKTLNQTWLQQMARGKGQLREKMAFFWHDHFACRLNTAFLAVAQLETLRQHALGKFGTLLMAVAKDPAMLKFLNNQQNKKEHPNENFARELLELFTLGRGNYTEKDIQEAARAFTGWGFNAKREFVFRKWQHDEGPKTFMGKTGKWGGEDIIRIVLEEKQTARFLVEKLYRFLVNEQLDERWVEKWADAFYESDYDIAGLLMRIFSSDHFYENQHLGHHIKSPILYLVGLMRQLDMELENPESSLRIQRILGQTLFQPPNVAGWPSGKAWIDSSSLITRLRLPQAMMRDEVLEIQEKEAFAGNEEGLPPKKVGERFAAHVNWDLLWETFSASPKELQSFLQQTPTQTAPAPMHSREALQARVIQLVCSLEYQLC